MSPHPDASARQSAVPATQPDAVEALAQRLADPGVSAALNTLLDHVDLIALLVESLDQFVARSEVIGDSLLAGINELRQGSQASGVDVAGIAGAGAQLASALPQAAPQMVSAIESGAVAKLLATAEVSAEALPEVELLAKSLARGSERFRTDPIEVSGPVSLVKLLRDPDINRALRYFATVGKTVGEDLAHLENDTARPQPARGAPRDTPAPSSTVTAPWPEM